MLQRAFRLAYDGGPFHGFQRQPDVRTIEGTLFDGLKRLDIADDRLDSYSAAGRTDAGVSAAAQTVTFACPEWCTPSVLNGVLPDTIRVWASQNVSNFHATHDAKKRVYVYVLSAPEIDMDLLDKATIRLSGEHDFHNLTPDDSGTVRNLHIDLERDGEFVLVTVSAEGFPRQLVRRLVSLLRSVGSGTAPLSKIDRVLEQEPLEGSRGVPPAPAYPLFLANVTYDISFEKETAAVDTTRAVFQQTAVEHAIRSRHAEEIAGAISCSE